MTNRDKLLKKNNLEGMEIDKEISKDHPHNDEIAILRKTIYRLMLLMEVPQFEFKEFMDYYQEAETKKAEVKARLT